MIKKPELVSTPSARVEIHISKLIMSKYKKSARNVSSSILCIHIHNIVIGNAPSSRMTTIADSVELIFPMLDYIIFGRCTSYSVYCRHIARKGAPQLF